MRPIKFRVWDKGQGEFKPPRWIYLTSLPTHSLPYQIALAEYVKANNVLLAFQPGTYQIKMSKELRYPPLSANAIII